MKWLRQTSLARKTIFQFLLFLLPSQLGYHIWLKSSYLFGVKVDYFAPTIYFTDVLILSLLGLLLIQKVFTKTTLIGKREALLVGSIFLFAIINSLFATSPVIAIIKWLKIFELLFLVLYIKNEIKVNFKDLVFLPLVLGTLWTSLIGILQFLSQKSLGGIFYFFGERTFNFSTPGIALGNFLGGFALRAYSTFSHPNSFAGFLGGVLIVLILYKTNQNKWKIIRGLAIALILVALYLALSRWVLISLAITGTAILLVEKNLIKFKTTIVILFFITFIGSLIFPVLSSIGLDENTNLPETVSERIFLSRRALQIAAKNPLLGVGLNNYLFELPGANTTPYTWRLQPVHNIPLLLLSEVGLTGLIFCAIFLWKCFQKTSISLENNSYKIFTWTLFFILVTGLTDHYWVTLQQNQLFLALILGLVLKKHKS